MITEIAIDLDQTLADMIRGAMDLFKVEYEPGDRWLDVAEWDGISGAINARCRVSEDGRLTEDQVWTEVARQPAEWWASFEKLPHADQIVEAALRKVGRMHVYVLTAPMSSCLGACVEGKRAWVQKHYPDLAKRIVFADEKFRAASPTRLLVDDAEHNVNAWGWAGGPALLWPACWNWRRHHDPADALLQLKTW